METASDRFKRIVGINSDFIDFEGANQFTNLMSIRISPRDNMFIISCQVNRETKVDTVSGYLNYISDCLEGKIKDSLFYKHRRLFKATLQRLY